MKAKTKHTKKHRNPKKNKPRKSKRAGAPDDFGDQTPKDQIERVVDLLKEDRTKQAILKDRKKPSLNLILNREHMNRLSYWNASQIFDGGLGNRDDMKNIVYMLKHPDIKYKKKNMDTWLKHVMDGMFKDTTFLAFKDRLANFPRIKEYGGTITLKDLTLTLLNHRIKLLEWMETSDARADARADARTDARADARADARPVRADPELRAEETTPENWNQEDSPKLFKALSADIE
jgi:hypothetical protein